MNPAVDIHKPGDVFQINEKHGRAGWVGTFVMAEKIRPWGIQGFVAVLKTHEEQQRAYIRLEWEHIDYVGHAQLVPEDVSEIRAKFEAEKASRGG